MRIHPRTFVNEERLQLGDGLARVFLLARQDPAKHQRKRVIEQQLHTRAIVLVAVRFEHQRAGHPFSITPDEGEAIGAGRIGPPVRGRMPIIMQVSARRERGLVGDRVQRTCHRLVCPRQHLGEQARVRVSQLKAPDGLRPQRDEGVGTTHQGTVGVIKHVAIPVVTKVQFTERRDPGAMLAVAKAPFHEFERTLYLLLIGFVIGHQRLDFPLQLIRGGVNGCVLEYRLVDRRQKHWHAHGHRLEHHPAKRFHQVGVGVIDEHVMVGEEFRRMHRPKLLDAPARRTLTTKQIDRRIGAAQDMYFITRRIRVDLQDLLGRGRPFDVLVARMPADADALAGGRPHRPPPFVDINDVGPVLR